MAQLRSDATLMTTRTLGGAGEGEPDRSTRTAIAVEIVTTGQIPQQPQRLTRRKRQIVVAVDQWQDHAYVWFVRRGHSGTPVDETIRLEHDGNRWQPNGGGGGEPGADLEQRPHMTDLEQRYRNLPQGPSDRIPFAARSGASYGKRRASLQFQAAQEAITLTFSDREPRQIAPHGHCLIAYNPRQPPTITALDTNDNQLGSHTPQVQPFQRRWHWNRRFRQSGRNRRLRRSPNKRRR